MDNEIWFGRIYFLLLFFVTIRILGWWISMYIKEKYAVKQVKLLEEILKERKDKNLEEIFREVK
jgi:hypothetical protein